MIPVLEVPSNPLNSIFTWLVIPPTDLMMVSKMRSLVHLLHPPSGVLNIVQQQRPKRVKREIVAVKRESDQNKYLIISGLCVCFKRWHSKKYTFLSTRKTVTSKYKKGFLKGVLVWLVVLMMNKWIKLLWAQLL